jgi:hypothetical protein
MPAATKQEHARIPGLATTEETQVRLGRIGRSILHNLTVSGELQSLKIGRRRYYTIESIDALIERRLEGRPLGAFERQAE